MKETYREYTEKISAKTESEHRIIGYIAAQTELELLFGIHNLTSDAEGEEMLTVKAKTVREMYAANDRLKASFPGTIAEADADKINHILRHLFGSKCLPDNVDSFEHLELKANGYTPIPEKTYLSKLNKTEPKPAEPKFKVGDKVKYIINPFDYDSYKVDDIKHTINGFKYRIQGLITISNVNESDLKPYTEPEKKNHFEQDLEMVTQIDWEQRRYELAKELMKGLVANPHEDVVGQSIDTLVAWSVGGADELIKRLQEKNR